MVSGSVRFVNQYGNPVSVTGNIAMRITPEEYQVNGSWLSLDCPVNKSSGTFGTGCYTYIPLDDVYGAFNDRSKSFQFVVFNDENLDRRMNPSEPVFCFSDGVYTGSWENLTYTCEIYEEGGDDGDSGGGNSGNNVPSISVYSLGGGTSIKGQKYTVRFALQDIDIDGDFDKFAILWGDGTSDIVTLSTSSTEGFIESLSHTYSSVGYYTWKARGIDKAGNKSNLLEQQVVVRSK